MPALSGSPLSRPQGPSHRCASACVHVRACVTASQADPARPRKLLHLERDGAHLRPLPKPDGAPGPSAWTAPTHPVAGANERPALPTGLRRAWRSRGPRAPFHQHVNLFQPPEAVGGLLPLVPTSLSKARLMQKPVSSPGAGSPTPFRTLLCQPATSSPHEGLFPTWAARDGPRVTGLTPCQVAHPPHLGSVSPTPPPRLSGRQTSLPHSP